MGRSLGCVARGYLGKRGKLSGQADVLWLLPTRAVSGACTHTGGLVHTRFLPQAHTLLTECIAKKGAVLGGRSPDAGPGHSAVQMAFPPAGGAILSKLNARCETGFLLYASRL